MFWRIGECGMTVAGKPHSPEPEILLINTFTNNHLRPSENLTLSSKWPKALYNMVLRPKGLKI